MAKVVVNAERKKGFVNKNIYGQFAEHLGRCIYEGLYVGEDSDIENKNGMRTDVVEALKEMGIPLLRWPGGCFADDYHWRDGIGDKSKRPYMVNTNWGGVVENNHFGTHEFFELCEQLDAEPYICGNVGSGTVQEMRDWIEYMTFDGASPLADERRANGREEPWKLKYFGVGNENWGCGGNMRPEYYADLYRRYSTFARNYGDNKLYKIAGGPGDFNYHWTEVLMREARHCMDAMSLHYYTMPGSWTTPKGDSIDFTEKEWYQTMKSALRMEEAITNHTTIMDKYDPEKKVGLIVDEWGTWFDVLPGTNPGFLYQQNTIRDAVSAVLTLHTFHNHCDRVVMANLAQLVNVLQAPILTEGEKMVLTPTYYLLKMMKNHQDSSLLDIDYTAPEVGCEEMVVPKFSVSATEKDGKITISMCNTDLEAEENMSIEIRDAIIKSAKAELLTSDKMDSYNDFDEPEKIKSVDTDVVLDGNKVEVKLPPMSVVVVTLDK